MRAVTIDPVTRIEGHAKISVFMDDNGEVADAQLNVTQIRGFERFTAGRPFYEMPSITARICGICPVSHLLASSKACDAIMAVQIPKPGFMLRELVHMGQIIQSHALSFFHLSAPDLLLGFDSDPAKRNVIGLLEKFPDAAKQGVWLRKFGQQIIEWISHDRVHPHGIVPGGMSDPLSKEVRDRILTEMPYAIKIAESAIKLLGSLLDQFPDEIEHFGNFDSMYMGLVNKDGGLALYDGAMRFTDAAGKVIEEVTDPNDYSRVVGEAVEPWSYMKMPYYKPIGYPQGMYRVGPLGRLNVADACGTPKADKALKAYRKNHGRIVKSSFFYYYARLIELLYALEKAEQLLNDPLILDTHVRAVAGPNAQEGVGIIEAPRGTLFHHYKVDDDGLITWANLIVATGNNNLAINKSITQVGKHFVKGDKIEEGALNRMEAVVRAYDPCLSCATHAVGQMPMIVDLVGSDGTVLDTVTRSSASC